MNLKKYSYSDVILLQWPTCPLGYPLSYSIPCCSVQASFFITKVERYKSSLFNLSVMGFSHRRSQGGPKGPCLPQIFRKDSHFVLSTAFF